jgi:hypothetical protein
MGRKKIAYAVVRGHNPGIYSTWDECKQQVDSPHKMVAESVLNRDAQPSRFPRWTATRPRSTKVLGLCKRRRNGSMGNSRDMHPPLPR